MENVICNLCGSNNYKQLLVREDLNLFTKGQFQVTQCTRCGLIYLNPRPSPAEILNYYLDNYDQYNVAVEDEKNILVKWGRRYGLRKRTKAIQKYKTDGKLLDIGCATGDFIAAMKNKRGWQVVGVEPNKKAAKYVRERFNIQVHKSFIKHTNLLCNSFDVVTLWNVIEHLPDPSESLNAIYQLLTQDGLLVISTPNLNSFHATLFGNYWIGYELPRHLYVFSLQTLSLLLNRSGFKIIESSCIYGEYAAVASSLRFWLRAKFGKKRWVKFVEKVVFSYPARILLAPLLFLATKLPKGCSTPTVFATKSNKVNYNAL